MTQKNTYYPQNYDIFVGLDVDKKHYDLTLREKRSIIMIKKLAVITMITVFAAALTGCNTVHGLGKDIERLGQAVKQSSDKK